MKKSKAILFSAMMIAVVSISLISGCKKEDSNASCTGGIKNQNETGVDCGGSCNACACALGYEGANCTTETRAKYYRTVTGTDSCNSGITNNTLTISADPFSVLKVDILGLNSNIHYQGTVQANGNITILSQEVAGVTVAGSVVLVNNKLRITYTKAVVGAVSYSCVWIED